MLTVHLLFGLDNCLAINSQHKSGVGMFMILQPPTHISEWNDSNDIFKLRRILRYKKCVHMYVQKIVVLCQIELKIYLFTDQKLSGCEFLCNKKNFIKKTLKSLRKPTFWRIETTFNDSRQKNISVERSSDSWYCAIMCSRCNT